DELADVAAQQRDALPQEADGVTMGPHFLGNALELARPADEWRQVEAVCGLDDAAGALAGIALAVGTVAPDDETGLDERSEMAPEGRSRHAVGTQGEFAVGGKDDEIASRRQHRFRMKGQKGVQDGERAVA